MIPSSRTARLASASARMRPRMSLTIRTAARLLDSGMVTSQQLSLFCHSMAVAGDDIWGLNAFNFLVSRDVLQEHAQLSDERRKHGETLSVFDGIPVSIKANIAEQSLPLTAGSAILGHGYTETQTKIGSISPPPACGYDADTVRILLREKGGICLGLTSMDEFGMGSLGTNIPPASTGGTAAPQARSVKNPLPFLRHLRLDDNDNHIGDGGGGAIMVGEGTTGSTSSDDERWAAIVALSPEAIAEKHSEALESIRNSATNNPGGDFYSAGGSSSGSAASVAHGSSLLSLGTDTGGSVRLPAAWCGLVGLKPSYGLLSRHGVVSYASSFDTVGVLANSVDCAASALDVLAQRNITFSRDSTFSCYHDDDNDNVANSYAELSIAQSMAPGDDEEETDHQPLKGIKVGIPASFSVTECPTEIRESWSKAAETLQQNGAEIVQVSTEAISPALVQRALSAYYVLVSAEASSNLSRYDGFRYGVTAPISDDEDGDGIETNRTPLERQYAASRGQGFGKEVSKRVLCGASVLSSDKFHSHYEAAAKLRAALAEELSSVLEDQADVLLIPTVLSTPPLLCDHGPNQPQSQQQQQLESSNDNNNNNHNNTAIFANDVMTVPASLAGLPAVSVPVTIRGEETFWGGMQLISSRLNESVLLKSAKVLE